MPEVDLRASDGRGAKVDRFWRALQAYVDQLAELRRVLDPAAEAMREVREFRGGGALAEGAGPPRYVGALGEEIERAGAIQRRLLAYVDDASGAFLPLGGSSAIRLDERELATLTAALRARRDHLDELRSRAALAPELPASLLPALLEHLALMDAELARAPFEGVEEGRLLGCLRHLRAGKRAAYEQIRAALLLDGPGAGGIA